MLWKAVVVLSLVAANGFFVAAEFALVKVRLSEIRLLAQAGSRAAGIVQRQLERLDSYLSACQLGITLASLGLGWVGEPFVAQSILPLFARFDISPDAVHYVAFPLAFFSITFLHITAGEQAPKILAIHKNVATSLVVGVPLSVFYFVFRPFIWFLNASSNLMLRAIGIRAEGGHAEILTEEQLRLVLHDSVKAGHVSGRERLLVENVLDMEDKIARRYMVPRHLIIYLDRNDSMDVKLRKVSESGRTRLPLCDGDLDTILGIVNVKDVFAAITQEQEELKTLVTMAREPLYLPENVKLDALLREFQMNHTPLALLVDEYGVVSGMITLEDVLEELVGPLSDEFRVQSPRIVSKGGGRFEMDAACSIDEVMEACGVVLPPKTEADSIGGVVIELLGQIPETGAVATYGSSRFVVLEAEPHRINRILIEKLPEEPEGDPD